MSKSDTPRDGLYTKIFVATIVVIWVSLVGGNWLGHYIVDKGVLGKNQKSEYRSMPNQRPKPWITVDPKQVEAVEKLTQRKSNFLPSQPVSPSPGSIATSIPIDQSEKGTIVATGSPAPDDGSDPNGRPSPLVSTTPIATTTGEVYQLQFGSFSSLENAKQKADELVQLGQPATVEEMGAGGSRVYRVRGGAYSEEEAKLQRDRLREKNVEAYIVIKS